MKTLKFIPEGTKINFLGGRKPAYAISIFLGIASLVLLFTQGLNFGIDFRGGILIEFSTVEPVDLDDLRSDLAELGYGDIAIQEFGAANDVLVRVESQPGDAEAQRAIQDNVKDRLRGLFAAPMELPDGFNLQAASPEELDALVGSKVYDVNQEQILTGISFRRVELVGPKVSGELINAGILAITLAIGAVLIYIWFRFEWQFGVGAVVALVHDVILTIGFFALTQLEFNLSIIAAILTIVGYSLNDTVVVYDRVRENLRRYRKVPLVDLFNNSINEVLARTIMTSLTTLLALLALFFFGGTVIQGFTAAMIWGVFVGTYSSTFVAVPFLLVLNLRREDMVSAQGDGDTAS